MTAIVTEQLKKDLILNHEDLETIIERMSGAFDHGLHEDPNIFLHSPIKMLPTYLSVVPDGSECGRFFAIDLGGTNLRFFEIDVDGKSLVPSGFFFKVPEIAMTGEAEDLFDFLANRIKECLIAVGMLDKEIEFLGFTFSFPVNQTDLNAGLLMRWTKGYFTKNVVGEDIVSLLRTSCNKLDLKIKDYVLINDTTGTLLCGAYEDKDTHIGIINGTGTNACYVEEIRKVGKWNRPTPHRNVLINTEWGAFGEDGSLNEILTEYDLVIDQQSINPGQQLFEKMISGMYLGEIVRLILTDTNISSELFTPEVIEKLMVRDAFPTSMISETYEKATFLKSFEERFSFNLSDDAFEKIALICDMVGHRSALLAGAGLAALINRIDKRRRVVIAADGSMFQKHPKFIKNVMEIIKTLVPPTISYNIILTEDGSGKGAALAACVASSQRHLEENAAIRPRRNAR